jgi:hypothetical protein
MNNSTDSQYWTLPDPVTFPSVEGSSISNEHSCRLQVSIQLCTDLVMGLCTTFC